MANQKAPINQLEQRTMLNGAPIRADIKPVVNPALGEMARMSADLGNILQKQQERIDNLKMQDNEEKLSIEVNEMNNALSNAQTTEDFDAIVGEYTQRMKAGSKERLGSRLYNTWENTHGNNYMQALKVDIDGKKIALNRKIAFNTANDTVEKQAYQWGYSDNKEQRAAIERNFFAYLESPENAFNELEKRELLNKFNHDREFGYLTQEVNKNPENVSALLKNSENFNNLSIQERERFKKQAEDVISAKKEAYKKGLGDEITAKYAPLKGAASLQMDIAMQEIENSQVDGKYQPGKVPLEKVMSLYKLINDYGTVPMKDLKGPNGENLYILDPVKGEMYERLKKLVPALTAGVQGILNNEAGSNTVFGTQIQMLSKLAADDNLNAYDISSILVEIYNEDIAQFQGERANEINMPIEVKNNYDTHEAFRRAVDNYYIKTGKTLDFNLPSIPKSLPVRIFEKEKAISLLEEQGVISHNFKMANPYFYASSTGNSVSNAISEAYRYYEQKSGAKK